MRISFNSRKKARPALKLLHQALPGLHANRDCLIVPPTDHLLRCFLFADGLERDRFYVWSTIVPLYRPAPLLIGNYGRRLLGDEKVSMKDADLPRTVELVRAAILNEGMTFLEEFRTPGDFAKKIDWKRLPQTPNYRLDLALSHYWAGDIERCLEIVDQVAATAWRPMWENRVQEVQALAEELRTSPSAAKARIARWEATSIRSLRLGPHDLRRKPRK
jgi:hypothetical protein